MPHPLALQPDRLTRRTDAKQFTFNTLEELSLASPWALQPRAGAALEFGVKCRHFGQHVYVMGSVGLGKHTLVESFVRHYAQSQTPTGDWIYLPNFSHPLHPYGVQLPLGQGDEFETAIVRLLGELQMSLAGGLEMVQYGNRFQTLHDEFQQQSVQSLEVMSHEASKGNVLIDYSADKPVFVAAKKKRVLSQEELHALSDEERARYASVIASLEEHYLKFQQQQRHKQQALRQNLTLLNREATDIVLKPFVDELRETYQSHAEIIRWLGDLEQDLCAHLPSLAMSLANNNTDLTVIAAYLEKFQLKTLQQDVRHGTPVIYESWPTTERLLGKIDDAAVLGISAGDPRRIRFGSLQRANGGYLILDAERLLQQLDAWDGLKRALRTGVSSITSGEFAPGQQPASRLEPEPLPLDVKIILLGERQLYYKLIENDEEFFALFNVAVDFDEEADRDAVGVTEYACWLSSIVDSLKTRTLDRDATARVIEFSQRLVEDNKKLSLNRADIGLLLSEADYHAGINHRAVIGGIDIETALIKQKQRVERLSKEQLEEFQRGGLFLDTQGEVIGQANGLFVIEMGDHSYGQPSRITATVRVGEGEVMDIEREVDLGGPLHSKGVYILTAYLASHYSHSKPLSLAASLVFEQSYGQVDGDSASVGEACALLSALADVPLKQSLAITGSINQRGQVQPVGGVNEKIESFFAICQARGLNGEQGVIIPATNIDNLMLHEPLLAAVRENKFTLYAVNTLNEALGVLSGMEAGNMQDDGSFPAGTFNEKVDARLTEFAELRHDFAKNNDDDENE